MTFSALPRICMAEAVRSQHSTPENRVSQCICSKHEAAEDGASMNEVNAAAIVCKCEQQLLMHRRERARARGGGGGGALHLSVDLITTFDMNFLHRSLMQKEPSNMEVSMGDVDGSWTEASPIKPSATYGPLGLQMLQVAAAVTLKHPLLGQERFFSKIWAVENRVSSSWF